VRTRLVRIVAGTAVFVAISGLPSKPLDASTGWLSKLDPLLRDRQPLAGRTRVVLRATSLNALPAVTSVAQLLGARLIRELPIIDGVALDVPNASLALLADNPLVARLSMDRAVAGAMDRTGATVGAASVRQELGYDGSGIGVAVIDSGVTPWHDDLSGDGTGSQRVASFVDLVGGGPAPYDDYGHGTHVAGIIAGNGADSAGARTGIAPGAHLVVLKVLDAQGRGRISDVIAALGYVVSNRQAFNLRIVNMSVATGVYESCLTDPLTLAALKAVEAGIVVVAAAGNNGRSPQGTPQKGGITAPGNAPWVLTVGASSHMGTVDRADDTIAPFSSRGPTAIDRAPKPDLVSPGVGIESLSDQASRLYSLNSSGLLAGSAPSSYFPYLSLSGTSMAAPVVSGTIALMLQANPSLTPDAVKAILRHTAQANPGYDAMTQGAGFLDAKAAVELAAQFTPVAHTSTYTSVPLLSVTTLVWDGTALVFGMVHQDYSDAGTSGTSAGEGEMVVWGTNDGEGEMVVWGTSCSDPSCDTVVWGSQ
jgi:serine protease AprX